MTFELKPYQKTAFQEYLDKTECSDPLPKMLPLVYKTDGKKIMDKENPSLLDYLTALNGIYPIPCDVFVPENLVYTFVGRPAYKEVLFPICVIIRPEIKLLENVFVFDTGAYASDRMSKIIDNSVDVNNFRIPTDINSIRKMIKVFFGSNRNYYLSLPYADFSDVDNNIYNYEIFTYKLLESLDLNKDLGFDSRCRTIENILRTHITIEYVEAIVMPSAAYSLPVLADIISYYPQIEIMTYNSFDINPLSEANQEICRIIYDYYERKGYFDET